jgi:hypothetical protein
MALGVGLCCSQTLGVRTRPWIDMRVRHEADDSMAVAEMAPSLALPRKGGGDTRSLRRRFASTRTATRP